MAVKKGTLKRENEAGTYDEINLKTSANQVKMTDGTTVQDFLDSLSSAGGSNVKIVSDIQARDALISEKGQIVYVEDATGDSTVTKGSLAYIYDGINWRKVAEVETQGDVFEWANILNKPDIVDIKVSTIEPVGQIDGDIWIEAIV